MATVIERPSKHGMTYRIMVKVRDMGSGKIVTKSTTWHPPEGLRQSQIIKELAIEERRFEEECKRQQIGARATQFSPNTTFREFAADWLKKTKEEKSPSSFINGENAINIANEYIGACKLKDITPAIVQNLFDKLEKMQKTTEYYYAKDFDEKRRKKGITYRQLEKAFRSSDTLHNLINGKNVHRGTAEKACNLLSCPLGSLFEVKVVKEPYAYETTAKVRRTVRAILSVAKKQMLVAENYAKADFVDYPPKPEQQIVCMDDKEAKLFFDTISKYPDIRYRAAFTILLFTGFRRGEIAGLEWQDINFEERTIRIERSYMDVKYFGRVTKSPKTASSKRVVSIPDSVIAVIKEYKDWYETYREMLGDRWQNSNRVFISEDGGPINPGTFIQWLHKVQDEIGLPHYTLHSLRHTNITLQIMAGVPIVTVSGRAGHTRTSTTTDVYSHFIRSSDRAAADILEGIFKNND